MGKLKDMLKGIPGVSKILPKENRKEQMDHALSKLKALNSDDTLCIIVCTVSKVKTDAEKAEIETTVVGEAPALVSMSRIIQDNVMHVMAEELDNRVVSTEKMTKH